MNDLFSSAAKGAEKLHTEARGRNVTTRWKAAFFDLLDAGIAIEQRLNTQILVLVGHCDKEAGECSICASILCPHGDEMHLHHDGCPSCDL